MGLSTVLLALFQGLSEFLPISSSGHTLLLQKLLGFNQHIFFYNVLFHLGTFFAVLIFFRNNLKMLAKETYGEIINKKIGENLLLSIKIVLAVIPSITLGFLMQEKIIFFLEGGNFLFLGFCFLAMGMGLFFSKFFKKTSLSLANLSMRKALIIGFMQVLGLLPGISRSGITIITALFLGVKKEAAFVFSFFIGLPLFLGAFLLEVSNINHDQPAFLPSSEYISIVTALVFSFISGWLSLKILYRLTINHHLHWFSYYLTVLGIVVIITSW